MRKFALIFFILFNCKSTHQNSELKELNDTSQKRDIYSVFENLIQRMPIEGEQECQSKAFFIVKEEAFYCWKTFKYMLLGNSLINNSSDFVDALAALEVFRTLDFRTEIYPKLRPTDKQLAFAGELMNFWHSRFKIEYWTRSEKETYSNKEEYQISKDKLESFFGNPYLFLEQNLWNTLGFRIDEIKRDTQGSNWDSLAMRIEKYRINKKIKGAVISARVIKETFNTYFDELEAALFHHTTFSISTSYHANAKKAWYKYRPDKGKFADMRDEKYFLTANKIFTKLSDDIDLSRCGELSWLCKKMLDGFGKSFYATYQGKNK